MKIVAEMSCGHGGSLDTALEIIRQVRADCIKFQTWTEPMSVHHVLETGPWAGKDLVDLYEEARTPPEWHEELFRATIDAGMVPYSTPFDRGAVELLEALDCPMYKIASFEVVDLGLVEYVARTGKPIIISTGQAKTHEIRAAVYTALPHTKDITLLHCVSKYPARPEDMNLRTMQLMSEMFHPVRSIGLSDHTRGFAVAVAAAGMGADMIEKHVTAPGSYDDKFAMDVDQFNIMASWCREARLARGEVKYFDGESELRRSLYFAKDLPAGHVIEPEDLKTARPNLGLNPIKIQKILGHELTEDVEVDQPVTLRVVFAP